MLSVLMRAFAFTLIIVIGIVMKSTGFIREEAGEVMKKVVIYITLPAAIITNFSAIETIGAEMFVMICLGIGFNVLMVVVAGVLTRKKAKKERTLYMLSLPAVNIGAFCLPFVQSFLPALGSVTACMFDVGNSFMCTGATYAFVAECVVGYGSENEKKGIDWKAFVKRLFSSPPLVAYIIMFALALIHIKTPQVVLTLIEPIAQANTFGAMLMLGLLFHIELKKEYISTIAKMIVVRHAFAVAVACFFFFAAPFDLVIRQTLVLLCFAPMSALAPVYVGMCDGDEGLVSCANSVSILCSLVTTTALLAMMGLN